MPHHTRPRRSAFALLIAGAATLGCGGDTAGPGDTDSNPPADLVPTSPTSVTAPVATTVPVTVLVTDSAGAPLSGVAVSFAVTSGGGSVSPASVQSNSAGTASATWTLAAAAGPGELRASVSGLDPVVFTATAQPGPAAIVETVAGDGQRGEADEPLEHVLGVRVTDAYSNVLPMAPVYFHVQSGGGTIQGIATFTDGEGYAYSGPWTLGPRSEQSVWASSGGAIAVITAGLTVCTPAVIATGAPVNGTLLAGDCVIAGALADKYEHTMSAQQAIAVSLASAAFMPRLTVTGTTGVPLARGARVGPGLQYCIVGFSLRLVDSFCYSPTTSAPGSPILLLAAPGSRVVTARSTDPQGAGAYTVAVQETSSEMTGCGTVFIERGITTTQRLQAGDCNIVGSPPGAWLSDNMLIYLGKDDALRFRIATTEFTYWVDMFAPDGSFTRLCFNPFDGFCHLPATVSGYYMIAIGSRHENGAGAYTLTID